ncbi:MAG: hypothetical protein K8T91_26685 [Planctomycetes bacterium]|nr:hypothetical protein [Planctomycetota bacterium]
MTFVEALAWLKSRPASQLSLEEVQSLRRLFNENPAIWSVAGGSETVERYLAEAERALLGNPTTVGVGAETSTASEQSVTIPLDVRSGGGKIALLALLFMLLLALGGFWILRNNSSPAAPTLSPHANSDAPAVVRTEQQQHSQQQDSQPTSETPQRHDGAPTIPVTQPTPDSAVVESEPAAPAWLGWALKLASGVQTELQTRWDLTDAARPRPQSLLATSGGRAELSAVQTIDDRQWLRIMLAEVTPEGDAGQIEVRADGQAVARFAIRKPGCFVVPLEFLRGKKPLLSIVYLPGSQGGRIVWDSVSLVANKSPVAWTVLAPDKVEAIGGAKLTVQSDQSICAGGANSASEQYFVTATMPNFDVRAVRLEALPDEKLPLGGPGRGAKGEFAISTFSASLTEADQRRDLVPGRYVRIELDGHDRRLVLSEVEVWVGGKNIALGKSTMQSSAARSAFSELAVDGNANGKYNRFQQGTVAHTRENVENGAWWEVDLGQEEMIEQIVLYNGHPQMPQWSANHRVVVLDMHREVMWQQLSPQAAEPSAAYGPFITSKMPVDFRTAIERTLTARVERPQLVRQGTTPSIATSEVCDFYFPLAGFEGEQVKVRIAGKQLTFRIQQNSPAVAPGDAEKLAAAPPQNLGRFRLSVTADPVSTNPDPPTETVALLPEAAKLASADRVAPTAQPPAVAIPQPVVPTASAATPARTLNALPLGYAWEGWAVAAQPGAFAQPRFHWDPTITDAPKLEKRFTAKKNGVTLSQTRQIDAASAWLRLLAGQATTSTPAGKIEVRADGRAIARFEATLLDASPERLISLEPYLGRQVKLELVWLPGHENETLEWSPPSFVANPQAAGYVDWKVVQPEPSARFSSKLKVLPDQSVLAEGDNPGGDTYLVKTKLPDMNVTAVRLEILPDASLPLYGPGRGERGNFNLGKFSAELIDPNRKKETHLGRYVRLELVGKDRSLTMAELEVFAGGKNVALRKPASQSTVLFGGTAGNAVDGYIGAGNNPKGVGFAHTDGTAPLTWWEVDLQQEYPIERLVVWNRQWSGSDFIDYKLAILNPQRGVVWEHVERDFPVPSAAFEFPHAPRPITFETADVSFDDRIRSATPPNPQVIIRPPLDQGVLGWHVADVPGRMQVATFSVAPGQNLSGQWVQFELGQYTPLYHNLGRFRLSVTSAPGPHIARRPVVIEPRLD